MLFSDAFCEYVLRLDYVIRSSDRDKEAPQFTKQVVSSPLLPVSVISHVPAAPALSTQLICYEHQRKYFDE